jgi:Xaa-Pro aminopeptidase
MVLMVEPYVWQPGVGGYRAEYCIVVNEDATEVVSTLPYSRWPGQ